MRGTSKVSYAIGLFFLLGIFLPLCGGFFPSVNAVSKLNEMRTLTSWPSFSSTPLSSYPRKFEAYFNDHFEFRNILIRLNNLVRLEVFNVSGSPKVLVGKEGWLFYTGNMVIEDYRGVNPLSAEDLKQWSAVLEGKQAWLASQGVDYLFLVTPNKVSVYPEYLPDGVLQVKESSPLDQLVAYLRENSSVNMLDLRKTLRDQKSKGLLFHRTDTHWTPLGAFLAYEEIARHLVKSYPQVMPVTIGELNPDFQPRKGGDLASMLGLQERLLEMVPRFSLDNPHSARIGVVGSYRDPFVMESKESQLPRAVMFHDSFAEALFPYLSENFSHIKYVRSKWNRQTRIEQILLETKPDIVIEESVERSIKNMNLVTIDPGMLSL